RKTMVTTTNTIGTTSASRTSAYFRSEVPLLAIAPRQSRRAPQPSTEGYRCPECEGASWDAPSHQRFAPTLRLRQLPEAHEDRRVERARNPTHVAATDGDHRLLPVRDDRHVPRRQQLDLLDELDPLGKRLRAELLLDERFHRRAVVSGGTETIRPVERHEIVLGIRIVREPAELEDVVLPSEHR